MAKLLRQNVGGVDYTMAGCALTGVCPTAAADYIKYITLSDGDVIEDGMMMVVTFANGNTAGNAPNAKTIYSSDQVNYFEDAELTVPFTFAPSGCYEIEYTGTANAYTYIDYPVFQVGSVSGPVCDYRGHVASGDLWSAGDLVQCMLKGGKFLLLGGTELAQPVDVVESGNMHAVTSNAVANSNAMPVNEVTANNLHSVTSGAVFSYIPFRIRSYQKKRVTISLISSHEYTTKSFSDMGFTAFDDNYIVCICNNIAHGVGIFVTGNGASSLMFFNSSGDARTNVTIDVAIIHLM